MHFYRPAALADAPALAEIHNRATERYKEVYTPAECAERGYVLSTVDDMLAMLESREILCAEEDGQLLGYAAYRLKHPSTVWVSSLHVVPEAQRRGIGAGLLQRVEDWARAQQAVVVALETDQRFLWAVAFYQRQGYQTMTDEALALPPYQHVLGKPQVPGRYIFVRRVS
ncbi:GNAT family N-acetyltransferase [Candidatus Peribacteria bacterium]|nr:GNAT family N-acetyltransferase [Candidatus Peribacteria bacterium]